MEEAPGAAAEASGLEFGSAERDIIRVPHLAMEAMEAETRNDNEEEESVPLEDQEEMFPPAERDVCGATEPFVGSAEFYCCKHKTNQNWNREKLIGQGKSPETFSDKVELDSCPPELGGMEQLITDRGNPSHPSGAPLQAPALSVELNSGTEPECAFEQFGQLTSEHGDQRWEKEGQQRGAEEHEISRSEKTVEETELVVLDPEHPLMRRFQAALKNYLTKQMEKVNLELQELRTATKKGKVQREELGVILYGVQQQLARLQMELEKSHDHRSQMAMARQQVEEELEGLRLTHRKMCQNTDDERKKVSAMQTEVENLALRLFYMQNMDEDMRHNILLMKQSTKKAEAEKVQAELEKKKQDLLVDRLTRKAYELQEQIALFDAQFVAQAEDTKVTQQAVNEACMEVQAINMEKKRLMNHWNSSLAGMKQRDEAYIATQELLSKYRHDLKSLEMDIHGCRKSIRKEEEKNELLVTILSRSQNDANLTKKRIAQCLSRQEALKVESSTYIRILYETEQTLNRTKMDQAARLNELLSISKDIEKGTDAKEQMENEIMAKLQDQMMSSKATKHFSQLAAKLHRRKTDLELHCSKAENDIAQVILNATHTNCRLTILKKTLGELDKEIKSIHDLISRSESEIAKCSLLIENKQGVISQYNRRLEMILSRQGQQELGPLEIEINRLTKQIEEYNSEVMTLQKYWLNLQKELVKLTHEREEQVASLDMLKKQITIMQQKKVRTESNLQQETKEQKDIERHMRNMSNDLIKLNVLINKNNSSFKELQYGNIITENEFIRSLKAAEKESVEMQEKHSQLTEEKERLLNSLVEAEHQIMLWEKKVQLTREMRAAVDSETGQGEIQAMRTEIHRMQVRYGQLMKQQEKMIRDMEASVSRREAIAVRGEGQNKTDKKYITKSDFHRKKQELRKSISETQKNTQDCNKTILELESTRASLSATLLEKQLCGLQAESDGLDADAECLRNKKRWNLLELVAYQTRQKHLQALKEGKYAPLCRTEEARGKEQQQLQARLRAVSGIVRRVQQEHPRHGRALQGLAQCLEARLGPQEA
ncbi:PREDICTED: coiled-coil domain-containing protein 40 [Phaethon lepturus]|uniref:coiled-coil domain-containing protein 40 n=1 Tax=Phaethon lepturus TaxID=97097 RepID=UPI000530971D|nr:PREDICTED: coiled-coil domain-containing protein 40 [Phaethon lepturus]